MSQAIYLDYAATTPVDSDVLACMVKYLGVDGNFANPASRSHMYGWQAEAAVEAARKQVATAINVDTREIVWTSGATEANNLAIKGAAMHYRKSHATGGHIITSATEHKAVLDCVEYLEAQGFSATYIKPGPTGVVTAELVAEAVQGDTFLVSVMHVNNETGVINSVEAIAALAQERELLFHVDAAQSVGKLEIDLSSTPIDMLSMCAHKVYGPKGVGALYVRRRPDFEPEALIHGGGHERGMRSGTLPTHQIVAMGMALEQACLRRLDDARHLNNLRSRFLAELEGLDGVALNGDQTRVVPNIANICFGGCDGQLLLSALPGLAISSGSACTSASLEPSHVLSAMGLDAESSLSSLRVSFGRYTTVDEVDQAARMFHDVVQKLKAN